MLFLRLFLSSLSAISFLTQGVEPMYDSHDDVPSTSETRQRLPYL